jgi:hypothetical protein
MPVVHHIHVESVTPLADLVSIFVLLLIFRDFFTHDKELSLPRALFGLKKRR